jgi:predicted dehydrogenase
MTFRWGVLGTGEISRKFVLGLGEGHEVAFVASRSRASGERFAGPLGIARVVVGHEDLAGVDAVYIATPPSEHAAHAQAALSAGVPVLLEKPFATSATEARAIADAAEQAGVLCMEAMWTRFLPIVTRLKALVASGSLGEVRAVSGSLGFAHAAPGATGAGVVSKLDPDRGGGALNTYGVYPLSLAAFLLGDATDVTSLVRLGPTGVDEHVTASVRYAGGALGTFETSLVADLSGPFVVHGDKARVEVAHPVFRPASYAVASLHPRPSTPSSGGGGNPKVQALREDGRVQWAQNRVRPLLAQLPGRRAKVVRVGYDGNGYGHQADEVARLVAAGQRESAVMPLAESVAVVELMDRIRGAA